MPRSSLSGRNESRVRQPFLDDDVRDRVQKRNVGPGFDAQPEIGVVNEFGPARIDGDDLGAALVLGVQHRV